MAGIFLPGSSKGASGDITTVDAGVGLSGGGNSGDVTLTLDLSELSTVTPINGDFFATLDSDGATEQKTTTTALATLFAGDGLTASSAVLAVNVDDSTIETNSDAIRIKDDGVTYAKIQNVSATNRILGRDSSGAGVIEEISPSSLLTMLGVETAATADQTAGEILTLVEDGIDSVHYVDGSIDTAHIADNQVTAAKLSDLARGSILIGNASAATAELTKGNANYVLTSDGTDIAWAAAAAGAADDITAGDGAVSIETTSGNITIDAQANDADVIIKVDDAGASVTAVTFDGSDEGNALFVNDIKLISDAAVLSLGDGSDFTITHDGTTGATLAGNPITITSGGAATWSSSAGALTITSAAAATWSTAAGVLTIDGDDGIVLNTGGSGNVQVNENLVVGVDDTGYDVTFFGASAGAYMLYDQSEDQLVVMGASADATTSTGKLLLATSLNNINANDVLGKIEFQAPSESGGTDAITVASSIEAVAQGTFAADLNSTDLLFKTGHSEAATEKFRITSQGELGVGGANYGTDGQVLTSGGAGAAPAWEDAAGGGDVTFNSGLSDESVSGITATFTAGEALTRGDVCYMLYTNSRMYKSDANVVAERNPIAMAAADISSGATGSFLLLGFCHDAASFGDYSNNIGWPIYVSETPGPPVDSATQTVDMYRHKIGWVMSEDSIYFDPGRGQQLKLNNWANAGTTVFEIDGLATPVGHSEYDIWSLTSDTTTEDNDPLDTNLTRWAPANSAFQHIGSGMTKSSGIFTFPHTGKWEISAGAHYSTGTTVVSYVWIEKTHNNSAYSNLAQGTTYGNDISATCVALFDVDDLSNDKVKLVTQGTGTLQGSSSTLKTWISFKKVGPT